MDAVLLAGPTACGKSDLAVRLAKERGGEVVSIDSCAVYRGMDIGSAKPTREQQDEIRHHLIDIRDPDQPYSAGDFVRDATEAISQIRQRGQFPILCGGTMLYVKALLEGLSPIPHVPVSVRKEVVSMAERIGTKAAHARLAQVDPATAKRLPQADRQRIVRALAVHAATGCSLSSWQEAKPEPLLGLELMFVALVPQDRALLGKRIADRCSHMFEAGLVDEVSALIAKHGPDIDALRAVGYSQVCSYLRGECNLEESRSRAVIASRQLAKRQLTWLRKLAAKANLVIDPLALGAKDELIAALPLATCGIGSPESTISCER